MKREQSVERLPVAFVWLAADAHRSSGVRPVCFASRASMRGAELVPVVEGEADIWRAVPDESPMGARVSLERSTDAQQGGEDEARLDGAPRTHVARKVTLRNSGTAS